LRPKRTHNGYRAYSERDLIRLEQIVALKFVGLPLRQINQSAAGPRRPRPAQRPAHAAQRAGSEARPLDQVTEAIRQAETAAGAGKRPDTAMLTKTIEVMEMQNDVEWTMKYYNDAAQAKIAERRRWGKIPTATKGTRWPHAGPAWWRSSRAAIRRSPAA
jgi:DNA-binding transcriptional MerR regulator